MTALQELNAYLARLEMRFRLFVASRGAAAVAGLALPQLVVLDSPFRFIIKPIVEYALQQQLVKPDRNITVLVPELIESHWYHYLLHNNRPEAIRALLLFNGNQRITVVSVPYHIVS